MTLVLSGLLEQPQENRNTIAMSSHFINALLTWVVMNQRR